MSDILRDFDKKNEFPKVTLEPSGIDFAIFDFIADDIRERQDNAVAMEFAKCIGELLKKNGVAPKIKKYTKEIVKEHSIEQLYRVSIDELDLSEHDKVFKTKIKQLEDRIKFLESKCADRKEQVECLREMNDELKIEETLELPFDPLECANYLINATYERETNGIERAFHNLPEKVNSDRYTVDELEQIAEHLLVYCKHNKVGEE